MNPWTDGEHKTWHKNGKIHYIYTMNNGLRSGEWKCYYSTGEILEISNWINGERHGRYRTFYINGVCAHDSIYKNNTLHGIFTTFFETGQIYNMDKWIDGYIVETYWKNGQYIKKCSMEEKTSVEICKKKRCFSDLHKKISNYMNLCFKKKEKIT